MTRSCKGCAMWFKDQANNHGRARNVSWCTHPSIGRPTNASDSCIFYVRDYGTGFDENVALDSFADFKAGLVPDKRAYQGGPRPVDQAALRARSAKYPVKHRGQKR